jgi:hypothetical protein
MAPLIFNRFQEKLTREPRRQDSYRTQAKPKDAPPCAQCGAVSRADGRWESSNRVIRARYASKKALCPACRQLKERHAGAVLTISGVRAQEMKEQVIETLKNTEAIARARNDQERLLWIDERRGTMRVHVTLPELARQMGHVIGRAFKGHVEYRRSTEEPFLHVVWNSDDPAAPGRRRMESRKTRSGHGKSREFRRRGD